MMLKIACPSCSHTGLVSAERLPAELVCSSCSTPSYVAPEHGKAITSTARFEEYLAGERARPQVRSKASAAAAE
jgi:hypothetical protein